MDDELAVFERQGFGIGDVVSIQEGMEAEE